MPVPNRTLLAITTGDADGIGPEVTVRALLTRPRRRGPGLIVFRQSSHFDRRLWSRLSSRYCIHEVNDLESAIGLAPKSNELVVVSSNRPPALWVEECARACMRGQLAGLVTAPLSKTGIRASGLKDLGHTEILARISGRPDLQMGFIGRYFNVVLATGHVPLSKVPRALTAVQLSKAIKNALALRRLLPAAKRALPIGLVGLNPHAGEGGLIGREEQRLYSSVLNAFAGNEVRGPLVPDAAFLPSSVRRHAVFVCPYHDQGLIAFKMAHGFDDGVHITLGLPFVRTSVDHGTAKDLVHTGRAKYGSMALAIESAARLTSSPGHR